MYFLVNAAARRTAAALFDLDQIAVLLVIAGHYRVVHRIVEHVFAGRTTAEHHRDGQENQRQHYAARQFL